MCRQKRPRLESLPVSPVVTLLLRKIGTNMNVSLAAQLCDTITQSGTEDAAVHIMARLGGKKGFNQAEDNLHKWLHHLHGFQLSTYTLWLDLQTAKDYLQGYCNGLSCIQGVGGYVIYNRLFMRFRRGRESKHVCGACVNALALCER